MKTMLSEYLKLFMCSILITSEICASNNTTVHAAENFALNNSSENLVISMYGEDGISNVMKLNPISREKSELVSNQSVCLSGNLSDDKNSFIYMNALDGDLWQVFSLDLKNNKTSKLTTDKIGKLWGKAGKDNSIYFEAFDKFSGLTKIKKLNTKDNSSFFFDSSDKDRSIEVYDTRNDKVVAVTASNSEDKTRHKEANKTNNAKKNLKPIDYTIYEMDADGSNMRKIASVNANIINSISYNYDCKKVIINGNNINNEKGIGIYEVSTENGQITKLLTNTMIQSKKKSIISDIAETNAVLSKDGHTLYFAGASKSVCKLIFTDTTSMPQDIYSYDLITDTIKEVYEYRKHTIITDLTISY